MSPPLASTGEKPNVYLLTKQGVKYMKEQPESDFGQFLIVCDLFGGTESAIAYALHWRIRIAEEVSPEKAATAVQHTNIADNLHTYIDHARAAGWIEILVGAAPYHLSPGGNHD